MPGGLQEGPGSPVPSRTPRVAAPEGRGEISAKRAQIGPAASPMSSSLCSLCVIKPRGLCFVLQAVVLLSLMAFSARLRAAGIGFGDAAARAGCGHEAEPPAPHCPGGPLAGALCSVPAVLPPRPALSPACPSPSPRPGGTAMVTAAPLHPILSSVAAWCAKGWRVPAPHARKP